MPGFLEPGATGYIVDTPENRRLLEDAAIPKCREWREANPVPPPMPPEWNNYALWVQTNRLYPAPYCISAYCDRCAGLRALDGVSPVLPNEWMKQ